MPITQQHARILAVLYTLRAMGEREGTSGARSPTLDECAAIAAALNAGLTRDEVLAKAGLSSEEWDAAHERWLARLAASASQGKLRQSRRYLEVFNAHKTAARRKAKETRKPLNGPMPVEPRAILSPIASAPIAPRAAPTNAPTKALGQHPPAPAPLPPQRPEAKTSFSLPPSQAESAAAPPGPPIDLAATTMALSPFLAAREATPFRPSAPPQNSPPAKDPPPRRPRDLSPDINALPFRPPTQPAPPRPAASDPPATSLQLAQAPATAPPQSALSAADAKRIQSITFNDYAQICATIRLYPDHIGWTRTQWNLSEAAWTALHTIWQERFRGDPQLKARWQALTQQKMTKR